MDAKSIIHQLYPDQSRQINIPNALHEAWLWIFHLPREISHPIVQFHGTTKYHRLKYLHKRDYTRGSMITAHVTVTNLTFFYCTYYCTADIRERFIFVVLYFLHWLYVFIWLIQCNILCTSFRVYHIKLWTTYYRYNNPQNIIKLTNYHLASVYMDII